MITFLRRSTGVGFWRSLCCIAALTATWAPAGAAVTVTDKNNVVYDIIEGTTDVVVSINNASVFKDRTDKIIIPARVQDAASTSIDHDTWYNVVSITESAFRSTSITSVTIEAPVTEIPTYCFADCFQLTEVILPTTVTSIADHAFYCNDNYYGYNYAHSQLTSIKGLDNVKTIGEFAFSGLYSLPTVDLPEGLVEMGTQAFSNSHGLQTITIPSTLEEVPEYAFYQCNGLKSVTFKKGTKTVAYSAFDSCSALTDIEFAEGMDIQSSAFRYCTAIETLTLKPGMTIRGGAFFYGGIQSIVWTDEPIVLEDGAFQAIQRGLTKVTLPAWMTKVPDKLFSACPYITEIELPEGVEEVGTDAFYNSNYPKSLTKVAFAAGAGNTLKKIGYRAFSGNTNLVEFPFAEDQEFGDYALSGSGFTTIPLMKGMSVGRSGLASSNLTSIDWPEEPMKHVGASPFGVLSLKSISFPEWMTEVPDSMCYSWSNLTDVTLHEGMTRVGKYAFFNCGLLKNPALPSTLAEIDDYAFTYNYLSNTGNAYYDNTQKNTRDKLTENWNLELPASLRRIGKYAYAGRPRVKCTEFNEGLEEIDEQAFRVCGYLNSWTAMNFPSTLKKLGDSAFEGCTYLVIANMEKTQLTTIPMRCYYGCTSLSAIKWPTTLTTIRQYAFYGHKISTRYPSDTVEMLPSSVVKVENYAFATATTYTNYIINLDLSHVKELGMGAFAGSRIQAITWPAQEIEIGPECFAEVKSLTVATFPDWMKTTVKGMYKGSTSIWDINFNKVEVINNETFMNCVYIVCYPNNTTNPTSRVLEIPSTVKAVGNNAFAGTGTWSDRRYKYNLKLHEGTEIQAGAFTNANINEVSFVGCPDIQGRAFEGTAITSITLPECMTDIPDQFFYGMNNLQSITLPENLRTIGRYAFSKCTALTSITFPATLESIGEAAFKESGLTEINWPENEVSFGKDVFSQTAITTLNIPKWMKEVPESMFSHCRSLETLTFEPRGGAPLAIGKSAFNYCDKLQAIHLPDEVNALGESSFTYCFNFTELTLSPGITAIPDNCFGSCSSLTSVDLSHVTQLGKNAFGGCYKVETIKFNDSLTEIPTGAFSLCYALKELNLPRAVTKIGNQAFENCYSLTGLTLHEGIDTIGSGAFSDHRYIERLEIPSTMRYIGEGAFSANSPYYFSEPQVREDPEYAFSQLANWTPENNGISSLTEVVNHSANLDCYGSIFMNNLKLKKFTSDYPLFMIYASMFRNCISLEEIVLPKDSKITIVDDYAFANCISLKEWPYETICMYGWYAFANCLSIKQLYFPTSGDFIINDSDPMNDKHFSSRYTDWYDDDQGNHNTRDFFAFRQHENQFQYHAKNLYNCQSFVWPYYGKFFHFYESNIKNAPLRGVSYCYARDIRPLGYEVPQYFQDQRPQPTMGQYGPDYWDIDYIDNQESILMVSRGQKWKYMEAGYGQRFNIMEMKNPVPTLDGDIFSEYDRQANVNHYRAFLRWEVELSDLNENGVTEAEVWRDGEKLADVQFSQPVEVSGSELGLAVDRVMMTTVTLNGKLTDEFAGDYTYPIELAGERPSDLVHTEKLWIMEYNMQDSHTLYYNAETGARLNAFERYGYRSLYTLVDSFDSPRLDSGNVPDHYTYKIKIKGYDYEEYVNNEGFEPGDDGHLYHKEKFTLPAELVSEDLKLYPATGGPTLDFKGMYTTEQVVADRDRSLEPVPADPKEREYKVGVKVDPEVARQQVYVPVRNQVYDVLQSVETIDVTNFGQTVARYVPSKSARRAAEDEEVATFVPQLGGSYQGVITTFNRGTFGTPAMTIPDIPTLDAKLIMEWHEHMAQGGHAYGAVKGHMYLTPDVTPLGYEDAMPAQGDYHLGVWRSLAVKDLVYSDWFDVPQDDAVNLFAADDSGTTTELVHHVEGRPDDVSEIHCSGCAEGAQCVTDGSQIVHTDIFDVADEKQFDVNYDTRLYVKVPAKYTAGEERWVAVDAADNDRWYVLTGIENVMLDGPAADDDPDARWYDLQGRRVLSPISGNVYIRLSRSGSSKVRYI